LTTITDVAREAGVSPATVSRVLNGTGEVSPRLTERVQRTVERLGYHPSGPARALRRQASSIWSVIVPDVENPFFTSVVRGIEDGARDRDHRVILCNTDESLATEAEYIDIAIAERVGGVVIAVADSRRSNLDQLIDRGIPVVAIDRKPVGNRVDSVLVDNRLAARRATEHLIDGGFARIACITGPRRLSTANERLAGYKDALTAAGLPYSDEWVAREDFRIGGGYNAVRSFWSRTRRPDALFIANNQMTMGALQAVYDVGAAIPDDVGVVGMDNTPWATVVRPQLTVVDQPTYEIGRRAAELLAERPRRTQIRRELLSPRLVVRDSSTRTTPVARRRSG
jgi:LacI family transcriptional regulator